MAARVRSIVLGAAIAGLVAAAPLVAQQTLDRMRIPPPGRTPVLHVPAWTTSTLANGAELAVSEKHDLPLVSFSVTFLGGGDQFESAEKRGLASLTASMMSEGTTSKDADALSTALQLLGTNIGVGVGAESGSISFTATSSKFARTLDILADMLEHPVFPAASLERLRAQRLVGLAQAKVQPASMADRAFSRILYGAEHPFGRPVTEDTIKAVTRDDIVAFHKSYFQPGRALVSVVGDVQPAEVKAMVEKAFAGWPKGGSKPAFTYPATPSMASTTIYLVDKPGAAQSSFAIGRPGPPRNTPDYFALVVMNYILGGNFQSRLNHNIREEKGYSYGVNSGFGFGHGPGAFRAGGDIVSAKTDLALVEFMKELRGMTGARPITDDELASAKDALIQRLPGQFASVGGVNAAFIQMWLNGLPADFYSQYAAHVQAITRDDLLRVARQYIDLQHLAIVIVGDRASIEAPLKATGIAPVVVVTAD